MGFSDPFAGDPLKADRPAVIRSYAITNSPISYTVGLDGDNFNAVNAELGNWLVKRSSVVPLPTAVWLLGSGLLGLVSIAKCKKA